jgi:tetratricopeptide (TPR) repeat protein
MTPFVGRIREIAELRAALELSRLVTLWGPAGIGKSRLARALVDEAVVCDLGAAEGEEAISFAVARALGVDVTGGDPTDVGRAIDRASSVLVLDGADHAAALRPLVERWLASSRARFVVTARSPLELPGEHPIALGPLCAADAAELFHAVARSLGHTKRSDAVDRIVERLDRHPLAIEWFAPKAVALGDTAALARLADRRFDESPLAASLDESFASLDEPLLDALARLAAFEAGAPSATVEAVLAGDTRSLDRLIERGLVRVDTRGGTTRVRAYAAAADRALGWAAQQRRTDAIERTHARVMLDFASAIAADPALADERMELEAIRRRFFDRDPELAAEAAVRLVPIELEAGASEAASRLEVLAERLPVAAAARVLVAIGTLDRRSGRPDRARSRLARALEIPGPHRFDARIELAHVDRQQSLVDDAARGYRVALEEAERAHDPRAQAIALGEIGRVLQSQGRFAAAREHHVRAIAMAHASGDRRREALERSLHARATHRGGQVQEASKLHERALVLHRELGDRRLQAAELGHLGFCAHEEGDPKTAESFFRKSIDGLAEVGDVALEAIERTLLARLLCDEGRLSEARLELAIAETSTRALAMPRLELTRRFVAGLIALGENTLDAALAELEGAFAHGVLHEVGFEALVPAYVALVRSMRGDRDVDALLDASARAIERIEHPALAIAHSVLSAGARGRDVPPFPREIVACSSDVRRALRHVEGLGRSAPIALARDGAHLLLPDGVRVPLGRRAALKRVLLRLFEQRIDAPGTALDADELIAFGWPDERIRADAANKRLRTAIWTLRGFGLEPILLTREDGYLLDPLVAARWIDP